MQNRQAPFTQRLMRLGIVAGLAGSTLVFGACSRPGSGEGNSAATMTPAVISSAVATRGGTTGAARGTTTRTPNTAPGATTPTAARPVTAPTATPAASVQGEKYVVQAGDTLLQIADRYGVTVEAIIQANKLENPDVLRVGQELTIPRPE